MGHYNKSTLGGSAPMICPICPMDTFRGTARVDAPVPRRFAVNQLKRGGMHAKAKESAMMKNT